MTIMVFKSPGPEKIHGYQVQYKVVDESEADGYVADGWHLSAVAAGEAAAAEQAEQAQIARDEQERAVAAEIAARPPTREELEQKAQELGLTYGPRVSDKKLREMIEVAIKPESAVAADQPQA